MKTSRKTSRSKAKDGGRQKALTSTVGTDNQPVETPKMGGDGAPSCKVQDGQMQVIEPRGHGSKAGKLMPMLVDALMRGLTVEQAAAEIGVHITSVWRWSKSPRFQELLAAGRRKALESATTGLMAMVPKVLTTLGALLDNPDPKIRMKAVEVALGQGWKGIELTDMAGQVERLKNRLKEVNSNGRNSRAALVNQQVEPAARPERQGIIEGAGRDSQGPSGDPSLDGFASGLMADSVTPLFGATDTDIGYPPRG